MVNSLYPKEDEAEEPLQDMCKSNLSAEGITLEKKGQIILESIKSVVNYKWHEIL